MVAGASIERSISIVVPSVAISDQFVVGSLPVKGVKNSVSVSTVVLVATVDLAASKAFSERACFAVLGLSVVAFKVIVFLDYSTGSL